MNWGKGIIIGMTTFVLFITAMGIYMFKQPDDYDKQYYEKGLAFDADYAKEKQVIADKAQPQLSFAGNNLLVRFTMPVTGAVKFTRPSDRSMDTAFKLQSDAGNAVTIPLSKIAVGQWQLVFEWESAGKKYLYQQEVYVQ